MPNSSSSLPNGNPSLPNGNPSLPNGNPSLPNGISDGILKLVEWLITINFR